MSVITDVASEVVAHIRQCGGGFAGWYCGIATNPRVRLFNDHNVSQATGPWIYRDAGSEASARVIERYLLSLGCRGGGGGGDSSSKYVYAYKITPYTNP